MSHLVENNILSENGLRVLSLFDGISCGRIALDRAGFKVKDYYAYEIEQNAIKISRYNYPSIYQCGDVLDEDFSKYDGIDLLIGGSPCQFWASSKCSKTAKKKREIKPDGEGWNLFMQYVRALHESKPKYFLYENNYGIGEEIQAAITKELCVEPVLLDSQLVSAQRRKRLYWTNIPIKGEP
ncbi:MAG: DNA cytosine methyltransferase, partial [Thomasclavelia spiroformis]